MDTLDKVLAGELVDLSHIEGDQGHGGDTTQATQATLPTGTNVVRESTGIHTGTCTGDHSGGCSGKHNGTSSANYSETGNQSVAELDAVIGKVENGTGNGIDAECVTTKHSGLVDEDVKNEDVRGNEDSSESESESQSESDDDDEEQSSSDDREGEELGDSEDEESGNPRTAPRTKNEIEREPIPSLPTDFRLTPDMPIEYVGTLFNIMTEDPSTTNKADKQETEVTAVVQAASSGEFRVLSESSILCFEDRQVLGLVFETFGRVQQPMYSVKFKVARPNEKQTQETEKVEMEDITDVPEVDIKEPIEPTDTVQTSEPTNTIETTVIKEEVKDKGSEETIAEIKQENENDRENDHEEEQKEEKETSRPKAPIQFSDRIGSAVYYIVPQSSFTLTEAARAIKGSDASNMHDEEIPLEEQEFSDDDAEQASKMKKTSNKKSKNRANAANNRNKKRKLDNHAKPAGSSTFNEYPIMSSFNNSAGPAQPNVQQMALLQMPWLPQQYSTGQFYRSNLPYDSK